MTMTVALTGVIAAFLFIAWLWRPRQGIAPGIWLVVIAYGLMGAWAFWFGLYAPDEEPAGFAYYKPTVLYWLLATILIVSPLRGWGYPVKALFGTYFALSPKVWRWMNWSFAAGFVVLGGLNLLIAFTSSRGNWEGLKYSCLVNLLFMLLLRLNFGWLDTISRVFIYLYQRARTLFP